jgi:hypothetical protein
MSGGAVPESLESSRRLSQRMRPSIEPVFDVGKHVFGSVDEMPCERYDLI